jgi:hypothetical protein
MTTALSVSKNNDIASACIEDTKMTVVIPKEILGLVFQSAGPEIVRTCCLVNKEWRSIALSNNVLANLFSEVVLPEGMTRQEWLLQGIHSEEDLLKVFKYSYRKEPYPWIGHIHSSPIGDLNPIGIIRIWFNKGKEPNTQYFYHYSPAFWARRNAITSSKDGIAITPASSVDAILDQFIIERKEKEELRQKLKLVGFIGATFLTLTLLKYILPPIDFDELDALTE